MNGRMRGLARNPSAPADVLLRLLAAYPQEAGAGLRRRDLPAPIPEAMLRHASPDVRAALAAHPEVDPAVRAELLADNHVGVRLSAFGRPGQRPLADDTVVRLLSELDDPAMDWRMTPGEAVNEFFEANRYDRHLMHLAAGHDNPRVRRVPAGFVDLLDEPVRQALLNDPDPEVRAAAQGWLTWRAQVMRPADLPDRHGHAFFMVLHRKLSRELVDQVVASGDLDAIGVVAGNPSTPPEVVEELTRHPSAEVRAKAIVNPNRGGTAYEWARSDNALVRRQAAEDPRLPAELVALLADDPEVGVRVTLALHHPDAPPELLLRSYVEYADSRRVRLTERPQFPRTGLARYAGHADPAVRELVALDPEADPGVVDRLSNDPDPVVRQAMAECPRLPLPRIAALLDDPDLAEYAAANPALPVDQMNGILDAGQR